MSEGTGTDLEKLLSLRMEDSDPRHGSFLTIIHIHCDKKLAFYTGYVRIILKVMVSENIE